MLDTREIAKALAPIVKGHIEAIVAPLRAEIAELKNAPKPENGKDADMQAVEKMIDDRIKALPTPEVRAGVLEPVVAECVKAAVAAVATPKDGEPGRDGKDGVDGKDGSPGRDGKDGRDGLDVKDLFRADGGRLMAVMSDGTTKDLGVFVGADGKDGKDGAAGADGKDGLGFDDLDLTETEEGLELRFVRGEQVKTFPLPVVLDRGVYKEGKAYLKGAGVTWGGSFWIAQKDTDEKPGTGAGWRLAVKKGRDGKEVVKAEIDPKKPVKI